MTPNSNLFYFSASAVRTLGGAQMCKQGLEVLLHRLSLTLVCYHPLYD